MDFAGTVDAVGEGVTDYVVGNEPVNSSSVGKKV